MRLSTTRTHREINELVAPPSMPEGTARDAVSSMVSVMNIGAALEPKLNGAIARDADVAKHLLNEARGVDRQLATAFRMLDEALRQPKLSLAEIDGLRAAYNSFSVFAATWTVQLASARRFADGTTAGGNTHEALALDERKLLGCWPAEADNFLKFTSTFSKRLSELAPWYEAAPVLTPSTLAWPQADAAHERSALVAVGSTIPRALPVRLSGTGDIDAIKARLDISVVARFRPQFEAWRAASQEIDRTLPKDAVAKERDLRKELVAVLSECFSRGATLPALPTARADMVDDAQPFIAQEREHLGEIVAAFSRAIELNRPRSGVLAMIPTRTHAREPAKHTAKTWAPVDWVPEAWGDLSEDLQTRRELTELARVRSAIASSLSVAGGMLQVALDGKSVHAEAASALQSSVRDLNAAIDCVGAQYTDGGRKVWRTRSQLDEIRAGRRAEQERVDTLAREQLEKRAVLQAKVASTEKAMQATRNPRNSLYYTEKSLKEHVSAERDLKNFDRKIANERFWAETNARFAKPVVITDPAELNASPEPPVTRFAYPSPVSVAAADALASPSALASTRQPASTVPALTTIIGSLTQSLADLDAQISDRQALAAVNDRDTADFRATVAALAVQS